MKEFNELKLLINTLTRNERNSIISYLKINNSSDKGNLSLRLFKDVCGNQLLEFEVEHLVLYSNTNLLSFKKLISRLNEKIIDSYINKEFIVSNENYDLRAREVFMLERQLLISEVMRYRGLFSLSLQKINKVISQSLKFEHFDILVIALEKKRKWQFHELAFDEISRIQKQIEIFYEMKMSVKMAYEAYLYIIRIETKQATEKDKQFITQTIKKLENAYKTFPTKHLLFYLYYIKFQLYNIQLKYNKCIEIFEKLIVFLVNNETVYTKQRLGSALLNKGVYLRYLFNFQLSIQNILESKRYLFEIIYNKDLVYEQLFISYYFDGNISRAKYFLTLINEYKNELFNEDKIHKILYYRAIIEFSCSCFSKSNMFLSKVKRRIENIELSFQIRLLEIINYFEMDNFELAEFYIDSFIKYNERFGKKYGVFYKYAPIIRILKNLCNCNCNFKLIEKSYLKNYKQLEKLPIELSFEFSNMFNFKNWLDCKKEGCLYDHSRFMLNFSKKFKGSYSIH